MDKFKSEVDSAFSRLTASEKKIINEVWEHKSAYIKWPQKTRLL